MNIMKPLAAACLLAAACGGDDIGTGTGIDSTDFAVTPDLNGARLESGSYAVTNVVKIADGCNLTLEDGTVPPINVANTGTTITVGKMYGATTDPMWSPPGYGFGTGPYTSATTATLSSSATLTVSDGCTYMTMRDTTLTFVGMNNLAVDFTETDSGFAGCTNAADGTPDGVATCTSHYTFNLAM